MLSRVVFEIDCRSLGITDCSIGFSGSDPAEVVQRCVWHLQTEHDLEMPDIDDITTGRVDDIEDDDVRVIVGRLRENLPANTTPEAGQHARW